MISREPFYFNQLARCIALALLVLQTSAFGSDAGIQVHRNSAEQAVCISSSMSSNALLTVERSTDLSNWSEMARTHDQFFDYSDTASTASCFYRLKERPLQAGDDWKNQLQTLGDPLLSGRKSIRETLELKWVKFIIPLDQPERVYFQDSSKYLFHYDFAVERLPGMQGLSHAEFNALALYTNQQQVVLGAVIFHQGPSIWGQTSPELGIQFIGNDPFPEEQIASWFKTVCSRINLWEDTETYYMPTFEQKTVAQSRADWFADQGIAVSSLERWLIYNQVYSYESAIGRLVYIPPEEIAAAYKDGRLIADDILLTDAVPAEVPPVAGIVTLEPASPNSHVAIMARSWRIPFVYVFNETTRNKLTEWTGQTIMIHSYGKFDLVDGAPSDEIMNTLKSQKFPELDIPARQTYGALMRPAWFINPEDIIYVGGKAANFGLLRRTLPYNTPAPAQAITFDLWDQFMDQELPGRGRLRDYIASQLGAYGWPTDINALSDTLAGIREVIKSEAVFTQEQKSSLIASLLEAGFATDRKIRFRSSTNVEDSHLFSGAGLYSSYSGCLGDDLDSDDQGPCHCDAGKLKERGVFRAIKKVYASFYNDNAFIERLRYGIDENDVGMAVLVHYSTPDEIEMANGVGLYSILNSASSTGTTTRARADSLVTQPGAVSVTNPEGGAMPEIIGSIYPGEINCTQYSDLLPLGKTVMESNDYINLNALLEDSCLAFNTYHNSTNDYQIDFEYKKVSPGNLQVKQMRRVPFSGAGDRPAIDNHYLIGISNVTYRIIGREGCEIMMLHRLKSEWQMAINHTNLDAPLEQSFFRHLHGTFFNGTNEVMFSGTPDELPEHVFSSTNSVSGQSEYVETRDSWTLGSGADRRTLSLSYSIAINNYSDSVISFGGCSLQVNFDTPQLVLHKLYLLPDYTPSYVSESSFPLGIMPPVDSENSYREEAHYEHNDIVIDTAWYLSGKHYFQGTLSLQAWDKTTISGLTSEAITLTSFYAQSYSPSHHNCSHRMLFDPWKEPNVTEAQRSELTAKNIRYIIVDAPNTNPFWGSTNDPPKFYALGLDQQPRAL